MKKKIGAIAVFAIAFLTAAAFMMPADIYAAEAKDKPVAKNVQYYKDGDKTTGIKSFTITPYTYYNMSGDSVLNPGGDPTMVLDDRQLLTIAQKQIFPRWGVIAEGIFRDQASQLVTIEGSGMMSSSTDAKQSFDRHFSYERPGVDSSYKKYGWAVADLAKELGTATTSSQNGDTCWDETRVTGITAISSLNDARTLMGQELRNCSDDNDVSKDDFLGNGFQKTEDKHRLPDLENDKTGSGYCNVVTCVNRAGSSGDYDYVSFGVAVYDFDITPVAAANVKYVEAATNDPDGPDILMGRKGNIEKEGISFSESNKGGNTSYLRNNTSQEVTHSSGLENSVTEETTLSAEDSFEWGMEQTIGMEFNIGTLGADYMFPRCTVSASNSWHELWNTMRGKSETESNTKTKSVNTELTLPGHTVAVIKQNVNDRETKENYQQPCVLSYKVAVFAMSGDYFNGAAGGIDNSRYDKQWMSVIFDGSDNYGNSGSSALGSLYNRAVVNKDTQGYDGAKGKYNVWCDKGAWNKSGKINWSSVESVLAGDTRNSHKFLNGSGRKSSVEDLASEIPLMERASTMNSTQESTTATVDRILPLKALASVSMEKGSKRYEAKPKDKIYLDSIEVMGYDEDGVEFFNFDPSWGQWKLLDEDKNVI
ncbi:MAG: hypothetical protein Q4A48_02890, partial [Bacillota bacterium]|nr:hypothetical protein [Bacillota bacterium]